MEDNDMKKEWERGEGSRKVQFLDCGARVSFRVCILPKIFYREFTEGKIFFSVNPGFYRNFYFTKIFKLCGQIYEYFNIILFINMFFDKKYSKEGGEEPLEKKA